MPSVTEWLTITLEGQECEDFRTIITFGMLHIDRDREFSEEGMKERVIKLCDDLMNHGGVSRNE